MKILLLEDDENIACAVQRSFEKDGDHVTLFTELAHTLDIEISDFDLAILDINLPDGNGLEYLSYIRSFSDLPVLILTVKDSEEDVLKGFRLGADDYITKPFSLSILKARAKNVLKRSRDKLFPETSLLEFKDLKLCTETKSCRLKDEELNLGSMEFDILYLLIKNQGLCLAREKIIELIWEKEGTEIKNNTLSVTVRRLREKLGSYSCYIQTARGIGYRWETKA